MNIKSETYLIVNILKVITVKVIFCISFTTFNVKAEDFFHQRYRGWLWFEEKEQQEEQEKRQKELQKKEAEQQRIAEARKGVEEFKQELEDLRDVMIWNPENLEHVLNYKKKEAQMFEMTLKLDQSYRLVNFINPEHLDLRNNPNNLYGRKIKENIQKEDQEMQIKKFAEEIELFFVFSNNCAYSNQAEPVLSQFAKKYGVQVEALSSDGSESKYFKTHHNTELLGLLGVEVTPTIILVSKNGDTRFELARGALSLSELEERALLAQEVLKNSKYQAMITNKKEEEVQY